MASGGGILARVRRQREVEKIEHSSVENVAETLEKISKFLEDHQTQSVSDNTHSVCGNYSDWWSSRPTFKLAIAEDNTLDMFYKHISTLYNLGIPLTLAEKRTPEIRFFQDIEIWGTKEAIVSAEELLNPSGKFCLLLGRTLGEVFSRQSFLDMVVFDASGFSRSKGVQKTSIRIVWPNLVVNQLIATRIRDLVVFRFKDSEDEEIRALANRIQTYNKDNNWVDVFTDAIYCGRYGIRMPLCDRVSPPPVAKPEQRPFKPFAVYRFTYVQGDVQNVEKICGPDELDGPDWIKLGSIRRDVGTPLTEDMNLPTVRGERPTTRQPHQPSMHMARAPGRVTVRTQGGSPAYGCQRAGRRNPPQGSQERTDTIERRFDGSVEEFCERFQKHMGSTEGLIEKDEGKFVWTQSGESGARIIFQSSNKRVYISGKVQPIKSLLSAISGFCSEVGDVSRPAPAALRASTTRATSQYGGVSAYAAPSAVYAPSAVHAASVAPQAGQQSGGQASQPSRRIVCRAFTPESDVELALSVGDVVLVTHDPEEALHNAHRWVYGENASTGKKGWFPLSSTNPPPLEECDAEDKDIQED